MRMTRTSTNVGFTVEARIDPEAGRMRRGMPITIFGKAYDHEWRDVLVPPSVGGFETVPHIGAELVLCDLLSYHAAMSTAHRMQCQAEAEHIYCLQVRLVAHHYSVKVEVQDGQETILLNRDVPQEALPKEAQE